jgi:hypothetical protein
MLYKRTFRKENEVTTFLIKILKCNLAIKSKFDKVAKLHFSLTGKA